ncbi:MAG: carboxypeptidase-like regulatory domain-containing protein [Chitinophagales bacterium]
METEVTASYPCSQKDLISVLETAWDNYDMHLDKLMAYKPAKYTALLASEAKARIAAARTLPDYQARSGEAEELRIKLVREAGYCLNDFQLLKGYIDDVFKGEDVPMRKPNYEEAGQAYYRDGSREDWESVQGLGDSMKIYIEAKLSALTGPGNMPATFQAEVESRRKDFEKTYWQFKVAEQTQEATAAKVRALNACYTEGMDMMKDAQRVYVNDAGVRSLFVFATLLDMVNPKTAGVRGRVQDTDTHAGLAGVTITFTPENEPAIVVTSEEDGYFVSLQMRAQRYGMKTELPGYTLQETEVIVETGTVSTKNISLKKF